MYLRVTPSGSGRMSHDLNFSTDAGQANVSIPVEVRRTAELRVTVLDDSGTPTAARVYLIGADARSHVPEGAHARIVGGDYAQPYAGEQYFYAGGSFRIRLPQGRTRVEVVKGFEYRSVTKEFELGGSAKPNLTIRLERWADMAEKGWYSGDVHVHLNAINNEVIQPSDMMRIAQAEDLNVTEALVNNYVDRVVTDQQYFKGRPNALSTGRYILRFDEEMRSAARMAHGFPKSANVGGTIVYRLPGNSMVGSTTRRITFRPWLQRSRSRHHPCSPGTAGGIPGRLRPGCFGCTRRDEPARRTGGFGELVQTAELRHSVRHLGGYGQLF